MDEQLARQPRDPRPGGHDEVVSHRTEPGQVQGGLVPVADEGIGWTGSPRLVVIRLELRPVVADPADGHDKPAEVLARLAEEVPLGEHVIPSTRPGG